VTNSPARQAVLLVILLHSGCSRGGGTWTDERLDALSPRERIAQLVVPALAGPSDERAEELARLGVGGVLLPPAGGAATAGAVARIQRRSALPLLVMAELDAGVRSLDPAGTELPPPAVLTAPAAGASLDLLAA
jgi:hypothetical protein